MSFHSSIRFCFALAFLFTLNSQSSAALQAARVGLSTISPCPSFCGGSGGMSDFASDGGVGATSAATSLSNNDGNAAGSASLSGQLLLPIVGSEAFSNTNSRAGASATGLNSYNYDGASSTTISLDFVFDGTASAPVLNDAEAVASVVIMKGADFPFSTDYGTLVFEEIALNPDVDLVGNQRRFLTVNGGQQSLDGNISIDLDPGDRIGIWAQVLTGGTRGGSADALNTLISTFSDPTGLTPTIVPSPSSAALISVALLALGLRRK